MPNAITAKLGVDVAPLKGGVQTAEQILKASTKRVAEDAKKNAADAAKAQEDASKRAAEGHKRAGAAVQSLTGNLLHAETSAQMASAGISAIGDALKLGVGGSIALSVVTSLVDRIDDAVTKTKEFREAFSHVTGPQSGAGRSSESDITGHLQETLALADKIKERIESPRMTALNEGLAQTVSEVGMVDGTFAKLWATIKGHARTVKNAISPDDREGRSEGEVTANNRAAQRDVDRLTDKRQETLSIRQNELKVSEALAAIARVDLDTEEKKGAIVAMQVAMAAKGVAVDVRPLLKSADQSGEQEKLEIVRKTAEARRQAADEQSDLDARAAISTAAVTSKIAAQRMEIQLLAEQEKRERDRADESGVPEERRLDLLRKANALAAERKEKTIQQDVLERSIDAARANSETAQKSALATISSLTDHDLGSKQRIAVLQQQITNLSVQRQHADENAVAAIDAQTAALKAQEKQEQHARNMLTPAQKQAQAVNDAAEARFEAGNQRAEEAQARGHERADVPRSKTDMEKNQKYRDREKERRENPKKANQDFFDESRARKAHPENFPLPKEHMDKSWSRPTLDFRADPLQMSARPAFTGPDNTKAMAEAFDKSVVGKAILSHVSRGPILKA